MRIFPKILRLSNNDYSLRLITFAEKQTIMEAKQSIWTLLEQSDDQEMDFAIVAPYMETRFCNWLQTSHGITDKRYVQQIVNSYMSAYERIYNETYVDVYSAFHHLFKHGDSLADFALDMFIIAYVTPMQEMLESDKKAFTKQEINAINYYMEFLASMTEHAALYTTVNLKIPHEAEFKGWLESINMQHDNISKVISSLQRVIVWYKYTSIYGKYPNPYLAAAALKTNQQREDFLKLIDSESKNNIKATSIKKTIQISISNIRHYFNFLNNFKKE